MFPSPPLPSPPLPSPPLPSHPLPFLLSAVYSHLQQELNYRYLQEQSDSRSVHGDTAAFSAPHSQAGNPMAVSTHTAMDTSSSSTSDTRPVKWCSAHITIAKRIQAHQQQAKVSTCICVLESFAPYMCPAFISGHPGQGFIREGGGGISHPSLSFPPPRFVDLIWIVHVHIIIVPPT